MYMWHRGNVLMRLSRFSPGICLRLWRGALVVKEWDPVVGGRVREMGMRSSARRPVDGGVGMRLRAAGSIARWVMVCAEC